jgi:hypothetical protein
VLNDAYEFQSSLLFASFFMQMLGSNVTTANYPKLSSANDGGVCWANTVIVDFDCWFQPNCL